VVTSSTSLRTIPLGLASLQSEQGFTDFAQIMAGSVIGVLTMFVMFLFLQRFVISAAATSGLKG
jgi:ABC-type glycerol-3-phosphate transport system permease component